MNNLRKAAEEYAEPILDYRLRQLLIAAYESGYGNSIEVLRSDKASAFAFSKYEETKCSKNDAHLTRMDWADFLSQHAKESAPEGDK
jgi:hypothetical protein